MAGAQGGETFSREEWSKLHQRVALLTSASSSKLSLHVPPGENRLQLLFSHFGGTHIGLIEDRTGQRRTGEISPLQIRAYQSNSREHCSGEIDPLQIRIAEIGPGKINALQIRPVQISAGEIGISQPGTREKSVRQICPQNWIANSSYLQQAGSVTCCFFHRHARLTQIGTGEIGTP